MIRELSESNLSSPPNETLMLPFALNNLIDSIKIHICIENFLKAILIANGFVVHLLSKDVFPILHTKQKNEPILIEEVTRIAQWEENSKIKLNDANLRKQIKGISDYTLGISVLLSLGYMNKLGLKQSTIDLFKPYLKYRNNLHYYMDETFIIENSSYQKILSIIFFVNENVVKIQNIIVDELKKGSKLSKLN